MKIAILYPEELPSKFARSISVINTAYELSKITDTTLIYSKSGNKKEIENFYKLNLDKLNLLPIRKKIIISSNKIFNLNVLKVVNNYDVFYVRHLKQAYFLIKHNKKVIYDCHEIFSDTNLKVKEIEKYVLKNSTGIIFLNKTLQNEVNKKFKVVNNQKIINNGHSFNEKFIQKKFNTSQILYIGSFIPWKGIEFLVRCINESNYSLNIIGFGKSEEYLKSISKDNIKFLGYKNKNEIRKILKEASITIIPNKKNRYSLYSTPIKLFEYMAFSNIVIAPNFSPIKEIITDEKNGFLFEAENCENLKNVLNKIKKLSNEKLSKIAYNAYVISKNFTWQKRAEKIKKFCESII